MTTLKKYRLKDAALLLFVLSLFLLANCKNSDDDGPQPVEEPEEEVFTVTLNDASVTLDENPDLGDFLIALEATTDSGEPIIYQIIEQSVPEATTFNQTSGQLFVFSPEVFDYEQNPEITVSVRAFSAFAADTATVTISVNDLLEFDDAFVTTWEVTDADLSITIPTRFWDMDYNYSVDWGDRTESTLNQTENATHTYARPGIYIVKIIGEFPAIYFNDRGDNEKILSIEQWGNIQWKSMESSFNGCENLIYRATDVPDLSQVNSMLEAFRLARQFNGDLNDWDVSNVTDMSGLFQFCESFDGNLDQWDVGQVSKMTSMFSGATQFNQPIANWDVSNVTDMSGMFSGTNAFNQSLNEWDVGMVTNMEFMFFEADAFEGELGDWDVSSVTKMRHMFGDNNIFSGDISRWDVSNVLEMDWMFARAPRFDVDLSSWDISSVNNMRFMFINSGMSINNYDATLAGWANLPDPPEDIVIGVSSLRYCDRGEQARNTLINEHNWFFDGDMRASDSDCQ